MNTALHFPYLIQNQTGQYYRGTAYGDGRDWTSDPRPIIGEAYSYTLQGAYRKIAQFPVMFKECKIIRID